MARPTTAILARLTLFLKRQASFKFIFFRIGDLFKGGSPPVKCLAKPVSSETTDPKNLGAAKTLLSVGRFLMRKNQVHLTFVAQRNAQRPATLWIPPHLLYQQQNVAGPKRDLIVTLHGQKLFR